MGTVDTSTLSAEGRQQTEGRIQTEGSKQRVDRRQKQTSWSKVEK